MRVEYRWSNEQAREVCEMLRSVIRETYAQATDDLRERGLPVDPRAKAKIVSDVRRATKAAVEPFIRELIHLEGIFRYPVVFIEVGDKSGA